MVNKTIELIDPDMLLKLSGSLFCKKIQIKNISGITSVKIIKSVAKN
jgi:hypothetical protein